MKMKMKTKIIAVITMAMIFGTLSVIAAGNVFDGSKRFTLKPGASFYPEVEIHIKKDVKVTAKADQGNVTIKVSNPAGKTVARGTNKVSFKTGGTKGKYKITVTNKTKKIQHVTLGWSWGASQS